MVVVVQQIALAWDKSARGGTKAQSRADIATRVRIPRFKRDAPIIHHLVSHSGFGSREDAFEMDSKLHLLDAVARFKLGADRYTLGDSGLVVSLEKERWKAPVLPGLPSRPTQKGSRLCVVQGGSWASLVDNERVSCGGAYWYQQFHTNIALMTDFNEDVFIASAPSYARDWRSKLW